MTTMYLRAVALAGLAAANTSAGSAPANNSSPTPATTQGGPSNNPTAAQPTSQPRSTAARPKVDASAKSLNIELIPRFDHVLAGQAGTMDVLVRLTAVDAPTTQRPPLDVALVLDRSGSMAGDKLASAKQAALETLNQLDDDDRLTLITYDDSVSILAHRQTLTGAHRRKIRQQLLSIRDGGGTALGPALRKGIDAIGQVRRSDDVLAHVMLLSDGLANTGESRPEVIADWASRAFASGIGISTLGVGLDYNEDLMTKVANAGGGQYHFIENANAISGVLATEFSGLTSTVASHVVLSHLPQSSATITGIPGYPLYRTRQNARTDVGSLSSGRSRELMVRMHYKAPRSADLALGTFVVEFNDMLAEGGSKQITVKPKISVTTDPAIVAASENVEVAVRSVESDVATAMQEASELVERGQYEQAKQRLDVAKSTVSQEQAARPSAELETMVQELDDTNAQIDSTKTDLTARKRYQKQTKAKANAKQRK